jgi:hypothetical protein
MRIDRWTLATLVVLATAAQLASAQQCVGFDDTPDDVFCPAVEWLKNRSITTGCGGPNFCPGAPVSRLAMAQFMQRLGKALTPDVLHDARHFKSPQVSGDFPGKLVCVTPDYLVSGHPRTARFVGQFWGQPSFVTAAFQGYFLVSTDSGANWQQIYPQIPARVTAASGQYNGSAVLARPLALAPGTTYRFGLFVDGVGTTSTFTLLMCEIEVTIQNANPDASPLDE